MRPGNFFMDNFDDMQQDSFKIIAMNIVICQRHLAERDTVRLERALTIMQPLVFARIKKDEKLALFNRMKLIRGGLHGVVSPEHLPSDVMSRILEDEELLFIDYCEALDRAGVLFKARRDLNSISAE